MSLICVALQTVNVVVDVVGFIHLQVSYFFV
jgi:hypothetical protein